MQTHATSESRSVAGLQRRQHRVAHLAVAELGAKTGAHVVLDLQHQVRRGLGVGKRAVSAAGIGSAKPGSERAEPVVRHFGIKPPRQPHRTRNFRGRLDFEPGALH